MGFVRNTEFVLIAAGPNLQIWTHRVAISRSPSLRRQRGPQHGNLEIPTRLRPDLEIRSQRDLQSLITNGAAVSPTEAGPNLQIWTHRVAISRSPYLRRQRGPQHGNLEIPTRLRPDLEISSQREPVKLIHPTRLLFLRRPFPILLKIPNYGRRSNAV